MKSTSECIYGPLEETWKGINMYRLPRHDKELPSIYALYLDIDSVGTLCSMENFMAIAG